MMPDCAPSGAADTAVMLESLRNMFSSGPAPYGGADEKIPLGEVLDRGWCELWYQPKIELRSTRMVGAEALARACHPDRGIVAPSHFLPGASEEDLLRLTEHVILTALGDWHLFNDNCVPLKLAVNVPVCAFVKLPIAQMLREARPRSSNWPGLVQIGR